MALFTQSGCITGVRLSSLPTSFLLLGLLLASLHLKTTGCSSCDIPTVRPSSTKCWKYRIVEEDDPERTESVEMQKLVTKYANELLNNGSVIRVSRNVTVYTIVMRPVKVKRCKVSLITPYSESNLDIRSSLYILDVAHGNQYPNNLLCRWNIPDLGRINYYIHLQDMDIQPGRDCMFDNLTITVPTLSQRQVACGTRDSPQVPLTLLNRPYKGPLEVTFQSDSTGTGTGFKLLVLPFPVGSKRSVREDVTHPCLCPYVPPLETMCTEQDLEANPAYQTWKKYQNALKDKGLAGWGWSGFRGCIGVNLFKDGHFTPPTSEECRVMTFGMAGEDLDRLASRGFIDSLVNDHISQLKPSDGFCSISTMVSAPSEEDQKALKYMMTHEEDRWTALQYTKFSNPFVRHMAEILSKGESIPKFSPVKL